MNGTRIVCEKPIQRGAGQSRSKYCSTECRRKSRRQAARSTPRPTNGSRPQAFQKSDGYWYCTYGGREHSAGDNSYPGFIALVPTRALVSWYSSHERDASGETMTAIYMAELEVVSRPE